MKITAIDFIRLRCQVPADHPAPTASFVGDGSIYLRVHTDAGLTGLGEPSPYGARLADAQRLLENELAPAWIGCDPLDMATLTRQEAVGFGYGNVGRNALVAGLSQALWDIRGKVENKPVYKLINPDSDGRVRAYASGGMWYAWADPDCLVDEALRWLEAGYTAFKLRPETPQSAGGHLERNATPPPVDVPRLIRTLQKIHLATAGAMELMVDTGCRLDFSQAMDLCRAMEELDCPLLEEPLPRDPVSYARLRSRTLQPIAGGECLVSVEQFRPWLKARALDILQPDANLAGMNEILRLDELAREQGLGLVMHNWANDISIAANVHLAAALESCSLVEYNLTFNPLRARLVVDPVAPKDGWFQLSDAPGLGVELDPAALADFSF